MKDYDKKLELEVIDLEKQLEHIQLLFKAGLDSPGNSVIFGIDRDYRYLFFCARHKRTMKEIFGTDIEIGKNGLDCITIEENRIKAQSNYDRALAGESHNHIERLGVPGQYSYYESFFKPIYDGKGEIIGATAFAIDVTERVMAEEALKLSQKKYESLFQNLSSAFSMYEVLFDAKGRPCDYRFIAVNPGFEKMVGVIADETIGKTLLELFPQSENVWLDAMAETVRTNNPITEQNYSGELDSWYEITVYSPDSKMLTMIGTDITSRKRAELELANEKERLSVTLRCIGDGVITVDREGCVTMLNKAAEALTRWKPDEALGRPLIDIFCTVSGKEGIPCDNPAVRVLEDGEVIELDSDTRLIGKDGIETTVAVSAAPLRDNCGETIGVVIVFRDMTEKHNAILQKEKLTEQLHQSQKMEAVGHLAGGIAHDFNNTLGGILNAAEFIKSSEFAKEERDRFLDMIISAADRAGDLTKKLLMFSRKSGKVSTPVDISSIVKETVGLLDHVLNKNISITIDIDSENPMVIGDNSLLHNILMNIAINAGNAMPDGGSINFTLKNRELDKEYCEASSFDIEPGSFLELSIADTGYGMTKEVQSHIFEPFFTTKKRGKGTGLGLATVYGTVAEHGGAITVNSEIGVGTVFHIYIPVTDEKSIPNESEKTKSGTGTILLIEDEELIRLTAKAILGSLGYTVICGVNGKEGVGIFAERHNEIDLIILDMIMPVMGGREALEHIREIDRDIPVIISSGFAKESDLKKMDDLNLSGFLHKPFHRNEISEMVARTMRTRL